MLSQGSLISTLPLHPLLREAQFEGDTPPSPLEGTSRRAEVETKDAESPFPGPKHTSSLATQKTTQLLRSGLSPSFISGQLGASGGGVGGRGRGHGRYHVRFVNSQIQAGWGQHPVPIQTDWRDTL